jgi:uncharacterized protein
MSRENFPFKVRHGRLIPTSPGTSEAPPPLRGRSATRSVDGWGVLPPHGDSWRTGRRRNHYPPPAGQSAVDLPLKGGGEDWGDALKVGLICCLLLALAGCSSPDNKYFTLSAAEPAAPAGQAITGRTIAIDDVTIPAYLDRPQIVIKQDPNRADVREYERWVEPLDGMIRRVLTADLAARLGSGRVLDKPGKDSALLSVTIEEFGQDGDRAVLRGQWTVKTAGRKDAPAAAHSFSRDEPLGKAETPDMVAAMSRLVGALGDEIAGSVGN